MIECLLCGQRFRTVTNSHLKWHGTTVEEYRRQFPEAEFVSGETRQLNSDSMRHAYENDPSLGLKQSESLQRAYKSDPTRVQRLAESVHLAHINDPTISQRKSAIDHRLPYVNDPTLSLRLSELLLKAHRNDPTLGRRKSMSIHQAYVDDPSLGLKLSKSLKAVWADPERVRQMTANWTKHPNTSEQRLKEILDKHFPSEWEFIGDGKTSIAGKLPDFLNVKGKKVVIDMFGLHWHTEDEVQPRIDHFKKHGFTCLIFWEDEVWCNENLVVREVTEAVKV